MKQLLTILFILFSLYSNSQTIEYNQMFISDSKILGDSTSYYFYIEYKLNDRIVCHVDIYKISEFIMEDIYINNIQIYSISYQYEKSFDYKHLSLYKFVFKLE